MTGSSEGEIMLRFFQWVVRFFDWLRALDDRIEATWRNKGWPEFLKWWIGGSAAIGLFAFFIVCIPGAVLLEVNRFYQFLRVGTYPAAGLMYPALGTFALGLATVALTIALISCPLFMVQSRHRER
jgi:hypothetical protein